MDKNERLIFPKGETKTLSDEEYKKLLEPYNQQEALFCRMEAWSNHAVEILMEKGYSEFSNYGGGIYKLKWHPQSISSSDNEVLDADNVLRSIRNLFDSLHCDDKNRIANASIEVGVAVARGHAERFEEHVNAAINSRRSYQNRENEHRKAAFQEWLRENLELIKDLKTMKEILQIDRVASMPVTDATKRKWFTQVYPNHLRTGAPPKSI